MNVDIISISQQLFHALKSLLVLIGLMPEDLSIWKTYTLKRVAIQQLLLLFVAFLNTNLVKAFVAFDKKKAR